MVVAALEHVTFTYDSADEPSLVDVDLTIRPGILYGVVGANASGKSTLCALIRGLIPTFHGGDLDGEVTVLGQRLDEWSAGDLSVRIGYVFQNPFTQISGVKDTVFEEIGMGMENLGRPVEEIIAAVADVVRTVGIEQLIGKDPNQLSGGQRQKVAFASVLVMDPDVIVIDEPTSQLDPESSDAIFSIIDGLKARGKTVLLAEHKIDLLARYADEIIVLQDGRLRAVGPAREILTSPELPGWGVPRPEVTELALLLEQTGRRLPGLPLTREEAARSLTERKAQR
ncbi:energy-coupling factor ABC transporter ATP-binding protein [Plantibacter sp. Mn2098]|uniref:energy-coupling factor ABC transporter ATP-binding protein n=1 Tax=Plantibacter sp. Mn2098 TaxID=3395266 RepID=UPI003BE24953